MLTIQLLSMQIQISWRKKERKHNKLEQYIHANRIEKEIDAIKCKNFAYIRFM